MMNRDGATNGARFGDEKHCISATREISRVRRFAFGAASAVYSAAFILPVFS